MTKPAWKTENMRKFLDDLSDAIYGDPASGIIKSASKSIEQDICVRCNEPAVEFTDEISRREFTISGFCQKCQDWVFAPPEDEEE